MCLFNLLGKPPSPASYLFKSTKASPTALVERCTGSGASYLGKNPLTGEPMKIEACKVPKFKAGKALKDAVNK